MEVIKINFRKPLYDNFINLNGAIVEKAIRERKMLDITVPNGTAIVDPNEWKRTCKISKKVYKYKDRPMILYGNNVPIPVPKKAAKIITNPPRTVNTVPICSERSFIVFHPS